MVDKLTKPEKYVLYAIGFSYSSFNNQFKNKPLHISFSKVSIIDILISSKSVDKKARALYKNIESLESKGYLKYKDSELSFTKKGYKAFLIIEKYLARFDVMREQIKNPKTIKLHKKLQTKLNNF